MLASFKDYLTLHICVIFNAYLNFTHTNAHHSIAVARSIACRLGGHVLTFRLRQVCFKSLIGESSLI